MPSNFIRELRRQHKQSCHEVEGSGCLKFFQGLLSNSIILLYLQCSLAFEFDLVQNPIVDRPFFARVDIGLEPSSLKTFFDLFQGKDPHLDKIEGMVQINALTQKPSDGAVHPQLMDQWRLSRKIAAEDGLASSPIGLVDFAMVNSTQRGLTASMIIPPLALQMAREAEPFSRSSVLRGKWQVPMNAATCIE